MGKTFSALILKTAYSVIGDTSKLMALGKSFIDWVKLSLGEAKEIAVADYDGTEDFPRIVKPYLRSDCDYIVVLFSDTPLITGKTVSAAVAEAYAGNRAVLKMTRGYVFSCSYIAAAEKIYTENTFYFDEEDFITAFSYKQVGLITEILKNRILDYHMEQGVRITDLGSTVIGCDAAIEPGVTIGLNNVIMGRTRIRRGATLGNGNVIDDCVIGEGAFIESSHASRSYIGRRTAVGPYADLRADVVVGDDCVVCGPAALENCRIGRGCKIRDRVHIDGATVGDEVTIGSGAAITAKGEADKPAAVVVANRARVGENAVIIGPAFVAEGVNVLPGSAAGAAVSDGGTNRGGRAS